jgi:hypothetical protein
MAERILMNEFKTLSQEPWTNIEVRSRMSPIIITINLL